MQELDIRGEAGEFRIAREWEMDVGWSEYARLDAAIKAYMEEHPRLQINVSRDIATGDQVIRWRTR